MSIKGDKKSGQSLIEILVAVGVGTIMLLGAITAFSPAIKSQTDVNRSQVGAALGAELLDNVRVFAEANWHNIDSLDTASSSKYYLFATSSPFAIATGTETILTASTTFYRDFYLTAVNRDAGGLGYISVSGANDPSTRLLTVEYWWGIVPPKTINTYLTRHADRTFWQTDWSRGAGVDGPASSTANNFSTSSNIDYTTSTGGSVRVLGL